MYQICKNIFEDRSYLIRIKFTKKVNLYLNNDIDKLTSKCKIQKQMCYALPIKVFIYIYYNYYRTYISKI